MMANRRRILTILAAATGVIVPTQPSANGETYSWTGTALGADARIILAGLTRSEADQAITSARQEAERLEAVFSLYRPDSELSRLNLDGTLDGPSQDFRILLARAVQAWHMTDGAFNPAIQPLWRSLARHFASATNGEAPKEEILRQSLALCDPSRIALGSARITMAPGMALTFNGIAQGYITDAVAGLLEQRGLRNTLISFGEFYALPGKTWDIAVAGLPDRIALARRAIAQSAGRATPFTTDGKWHHLLDPLTGRSANQFASVTVTATSATEADLLSTALYVAAPEHHMAILARFPGAHAIIGS